MRLDDLVVQERIAHVRSLGFDMERILEVLDGHPLPSPAHVDDVVKYITVDLGLDKNVFEKLPALFSYSIEENLKPKVKYITEDLGVPLRRGAEIRLEDFQR